MSNVWVLGGHGLVGEALQKAAPSFHYLRRTEFEIGRTMDVPFKREDIIIDLVPPPSPRMQPGLNANEFHQLYTHPHIEFLKKINRIGIKKYIFLSSGGAIYGRSQNFTPFTEVDVLDPVSNYGESKKIIEEYIFQSGLNFTILRPSNIFNSLPYGSKQSGIIGTFLTQFSQHLPIEVFGAMTITKDYIGSEDMARAILLSLDNANNEIVNIGSGQGYSISEIINSFEKSFRFKAQVNLIPAVPNDIQWMILNVSKAKKILNFSTKIHLLNWIETSTNQQS